jgi:thiamine biosynthesis protein ThiI
MEVKKLVIVRYGELFLKGKNRNFFITKLITNIKKAFEQVKIEQVALKKISDGLLIYPANEKQLPSIKSALSKIFGISNFSFVYSFTTSLTNLDDFVASLDNYYSLNKQTFKFAIRRN